MRSAAFYEPLAADRYRSAEATAGPWSPATQHGGPPSALLAATLETLGDEAMRLARITVEIVRPVPVADLEVRSRVLRRGARSMLAEAELRTGEDTVVALARGWLLRAAPAQTPRLRRSADEPAPLPGPGPQPAMSGVHQDGYLAAMEWRFTAGGDFDQLGPGQCWLRGRIPLIAGRQDTGTVRAALAADSAWGVGFEIDRRTLAAINTDVTLALHRTPVGEWLCLTSATAADPGGSGLAIARVDDADGECGHIVQSLLISELL